MGVESQGMVPESQIEQEVRAVAERSLRVSRALATVPREAKDRWLHLLATRMEQQASWILDENRHDLVAAEAGDLSAAMIDRLRLTTDRLHKIAAGVRAVADLPDPVGVVLEEHRHPKGFRIRKVRVPIGVIGIVYESRPNVTIDCAILCLKSGNATILRGGREAWRSNQVFTELIRNTLEEAGLPADAVQMIPTTDRYALHVLMKQDDCVHCLIPRGGESLIKLVAENARMPVIKHYKGVCNIYLDRDLDPRMAEQIVLNAKVQRPGVCNAVENLVVHEALLDGVFPEVAQALVRHGVELRVDERAGEALRRFGGVAFKPATEEDYYEEYLDLILAVKVVPDASAAIDFINKYGSAHSDAIVTRDAATAQRFLAGVDAAAVYWNVSTRFTDGYEFGLGAEIGISTDRLHARGPMGLNELTTYKYVCEGQGEIR